MHQEKQLQQLKMILPPADCTISLLEIITDSTWWMWRHSFTWAPPSPTVRAVAFTVYWGCHQQSSWSSGCSDYLQKAGMWFRQSISNTDKDFSRVVSCTQSRDERYEDHATLIFALISTLQNKDNWFTATMNLLHPVVAVRAQEEWLCLKFPGDTGTNTASKDIPHPRRCQPHQYIWSQ